MVLAMNSPGQRHGTRAITTYTAVAVAIQLTWRIQDMYMMLGLRAALAEPLGGSVLTVCDQPNHPINVPSYIVTSPSLR